MSIVQLRKRLYLLMVFVLLTSVMSIVSPTQALATTGWPQDISVNADNLLAHTDGSVTVGECNSVDLKANMLETYSSAGVKQAGVAYSDHPKAYTCENNWVAGIGGKVFVQKFDYTTGYASIAAYQNDAKLWEYALTTTCANRWASVDDIVVGADGNPYVAISSGCGSSSSASQLISLAASTGQLRFKTQLNVSSLGQGNRLEAYTSGVIYNNRNGIFRYFNYSGVEATAKQFTVTLGSNEYMVGWASNPAGRIFVNVDNVTTNRPEPCIETEISKRVIRHDISGTTLTYDTSSLCTLGTNLAVTPDGGAVLRGLNNKYTDRDKLVPLQYDGQIGNTIPLSYVTDSTSYSYSGLKIDLHGNMLVSGTYTLEGDRHTELQLFSSSGQLLARFSTEALKTSAYDNFYTSSGQIAVSRNSVYIALCHGSSDRCGSYSVQIHKIAFADIDYEYPQAALFGITPQVVLTRKLVALGDSYSSGEGAGPFNLDSNNGVNQCDRSVNAYAELLDKDPALNVSLSKFVACSGAKTNNIDTVGQWNETPQIQALSGGADIVTLSIGGNDVDFKSFAIACKFGAGCEPSSSAYSDMMGRINNPSFANALHRVYTKIVNTPNIKHVYVVDYPHLAPPYKSLVLGFPDSCSPFDDQQHNSSAATSENTGVRNVTSRLNTVILGEVNKMGSKFSFVSVDAASSPFTGHELCTTDPFFNNFVDPPLDVYSFHPNVEGQNAYAQLVKAVL